MRMRNKGSDQLEPAVAEKLSRRKNRWRFFIAGVLSLVLIFVYKSNDPTFAAMTVFPSWPWCLLILILLSIQIPLRKWLRNLGYLMLIVFPVLVVTSEELWTPTHALADKNSTKVAAVSLNCAGGMIEAAEEAVATGAEIIYLQESPSEKHLRALAEPKGYHVYHGIDASILLRGAPADVYESEINYTLIKRNGDVYVSLRLQPPIFRLDYYNPDCWQSQTQNIVARKQEIREIIDRAKSFDGRRTFFVGDFNATPTQLPADLIGLDDLWDDHGSGWPGSAVNEFPLARIDRFMVLFDGEYDSEPAFSRIEVRKTINSDHRMVVACRN